MKRIIRSGLVIVLVMTLAVLPLTPVSAGDGPDIIVGGVGVSGTNGANQNDIVEWGTFDDIMAYSFAFTACNIGTEPLDWYDFEGGGSPGVEHHPVRAQNMFRLLDGKFEQIGQSWLSHGFCALDQSLCDSCVLSGTCDELGLGCSDPSTAASMGSGGGGSGCGVFLGPKSDVNAATGVFPCPHSISATGPMPIIGRLQVHVSDLAIPGALYFFEGQGVAQDDSAAGNALNNASYREVSIGGPPNYIATPLAPTVREEPAIFAWRAVDPSVEIVAVDVPGDGRFYVGYRVTNPGGNLWHYEFAIHNLNSDRSGQSFSVPIPAGVNISNLGFHDVDYHSGEPFSGSSWAVTVGGSALTWTTKMHSQNVYANALRWGTLYNFRFDADSGPRLATGTLGLFKPGSPGSVQFGILAPNAPCACAGDLDGNSSVDGRDVSPFVDMFLGLSPVDACAELSGPGGSALDIDDLNAFVTLLLTGTPCP